MIIVVIFFLVFQTLGVFFILLTGMKDFQNLIREGRVRLRLNETGRSPIVNMEMKTKQKQRLIAVFPQLPFDFVIEKSVLRNSKIWEAVILSDHVATRSELLAAAALKARGLHIGTHGSQGVIVLSASQLVDEEFMARVIRLSKIELLFLMACETSNLATFCLMAGVKVVISFKGKLPDHHAAKIAKQFYVQLSSGKTVGSAINQAIEFVDGTTRDMLIVNGDVDWKW